MCQKETRQFFYADSVGIAESVCQITFNFLKYHLTQNYITKKYLGSTQI